MFKKTLKYLLLILCFLFFEAKAQLPFSQNNICLDQMQQVSNQPLKATKNMVVKDFNNDGYKDVLCTDLSTNQLIIYKNNNPGFSISYTLTLSGMGAFNSIEAGDVNGDLQNDIVLCYNGNIKVLLNNNMTFSVAASIPVITNYNISPTYIKMEDLDGDLDPDILLVGSHINPNHGVAVFAYRNNSTLTSVNFSLDYSNLIFYGSPSLDTVRVVDFSIGDIDGINGKDILFTYREKQDTMIFLQKTSSTTLGYTLQKRGLFSSFASGFVLEQCETEDLDKDGKSDYVIVNTPTSGPQINMYYGDVNFTTSPAQIFQISTFLDDFKLSDINTDGYSDFIGLHSGGLLVYLFDPPNMKFKETNPISINFPASTMGLNDMAIADYDGNYFSDICLKSWKGVSAKPVIIPNFAHFVLIATTNTAICSGVSTTMTASSSVSLTTLSNSFAWNLFPSVIPYSTAQSVVTNSPGIHYVVLTHSIPFTSGFNCKFTGLPQLISQASSPTVTIVASQPTLCNGSYAYFTASGAESFTWIPSMTVDPNFSIQASPSNYSVEVVGISSDGCLDTSNAGISIFPPFTNNITASKNPVCAGDSTLLSLNGANSYTWSITNANLPYVLLHPKNNTLVMVDVEDGNGCMASRTIQISIDSECELKIYTSVTPNGDNNNDFWFLENIERYKDNHVSIYNRWGQQIFETNNYDNVNRFWPTHSMRNIIAGTYFYVINLGNGTTKKGWIELIKS